MEHLSVADNISFGRDLSDEAISKAAALVGLEDELDERPRSRGKAFSGGQLQRIGLARAMAAPGSVCILDEPSNNLGDENATALLQRIMDSNPGTTFLVVTHNEKKAALCDSTIAL